MGNCLWGTPAETVLIKVIKSNGGIMEFFPPIAVNSITNEFPGHAIFPNNILSKPLCQFDELVAGQSYHLLPLHNQPNYNNYSSSSFGSGDVDVVQRQAGHVRSQSVPTILPPYRMTSLDYNQYYQGVGLLKRSTITEEAFSSSSRSTSSSSSSSTRNEYRRRRSIGIWKVKLVITPEKLVEILSQEACTKELIESVRIVAKYGVAAAAAAGNINSSVSTTTVSDDQWSLSSSCTSAPSKIDHALIIS